MLDARPARRNAQQATLCLPGAGRPQLATSGAFLRTMYAQTAPSGSSAPRPKHTPTPAAGFFFFFFSCARQKGPVEGCVKKRKHAPFFVWLLTLERKQEILREGVLVSGERSREVIRDLVWRNRTEEAHTDWTVSWCNHPTPAALTSRSSWVASEFHSDYVTRPSWTVFSKLFVYILKVLHNPQPFKWMESSEENHYSVSCKQ